MSVLRVVYTLLLRLYPEPFRRRFAMEMRAVFASALADASRQGPAAVIGLCGRELRDLPALLADAHRRQRETRAAASSDDSLQAFTMRAFLQEVVSTSLMVIVIVVGMNLFVPRYVVEGSSMQPSFADGDWIITSTIPYLLDDPQRGDVVVLASPDPLGLASEDLLKRVIGLPGETVAIHDGLVWVDGVPLDEPYVSAMPGYVYEGYTLGPDEYFVLGDNRNHSRDSHLFGPVPREDILTRVLVTYWPPANWEVLGAPDYRQPASVTPTPWSTTPQPVVPGP